MTEWIRWRILNPLTGVQFPLCAPKEKDMECTVEITNFCDRGCKYCSTNAINDRNRSKFLSIDEVNNFLISTEVSSGFIDRINISGGEPLAHPNFYEILKVCESFSENVFVYTNAITNLIYNSDIVSEVNVESNVCLVPGSSVYIPKNANKVHLLQLIPQGRAKGMKPANLKASGNIAGSDCGSCAECKHSLLQADGKVVAAPCKKDY